MTGPTSKRCKEDERLINSVLGPGKRGYIIYTRTQTLAQAAKVCPEAIIKVEAVNQLLLLQIPKTTYSFDPNRGMQFCLLVELFSHQCFSTYFKVSSSGL